MAVITIREALKQALREEMIRDERVFLMGEDIGPYGGAFAVTKGLYEEFGEERVRDTPIAEGVIAGAAMGAAVGGQRPVAEIMTINFALLTLDQMVNHAAKMHHMFGGQWSVPMVLRMAAGLGTTLGHALANAGSAFRALPRPEGRVPRHRRTIRRACSKRLFAISIR